MPDERKLRDETTAEGRAIWAAVDKAASRAPAWLEGGQESMSKPDVWEVLRGYLEEHNGASWTTEGCDCGLCAEARALLDARKGGDATDVSIRSPVGASATPPPAPAGGVGGDLERAVEGGEAMSFICERCGRATNTAFSNYWIRSSPGEPALCWQCYTIERRKEGKL